MDRTVLEGDPHAILEGMLIGSFAIGPAQRAFIYVRSEYPLAIEILEHAIVQAKERGLGKRYSRHRLVDSHVTVRRGAGPTSAAKKPP